MVLIQKYEPKFHDEVYKIFAEGANGHPRVAFQMGLINFKFLSSIVILLSLGYVLHSWILAVILPSIFIGIYLHLINSCFAGYVE